MAGARLLLFAILASLPGAAAAADTMQGFACRPTLPVFCRNIHVGCSGVTEIPTAAFDVAVAGETARLEVEGREAALTGRVFGSGDLVIRLEAGRDWIRIQEDGRFSHRIYRNGHAAMSYGTCRRLPAG